jgi:hypothetical protein
MTSKTLRFYRNQHGQLVIATFCEWRKPDSKAIVRLDVDGAFMRRAHLAKPFEKSAEIVVTRWETELGFKRTGNA